VRATAAEQLIIGCQRGADTRRNGFLSRGQKLEPVLGRLHEGALECANEHHRAQEVE
jgi:hypothetical protein